MFHDREKTGGDKKGGGIFLKLGDGDNYNGVFAGEPITFYQKWDGGRYVDCDSKEDGAKLRFKVNFIIKENGALASKIWSASAPVYDRLAHLSKLCDLKSSLVNISRRGLSKDTRYDIDLLQDGKLDEKAMAAISKVILHELKGGSDAIGVPTGGGEVFNNSEGDSGPGAETLGQEPLEETVVEDSDDVPF